MMDPDAVSLGLRLFTLGAAIIPFLGAIVIMIETARAIRAKNRAKYYLLEKAAEDAELSQIVGHHAERLSSEELEARLQKIESAISGHLSESDQNFVKQGLHQSNPAGARSYAEDVLSAA
jgi:hypothetical protein